MAVRVLALASGQTSAEDHRHGLSTFMAPAGVLNARAGIVPTPGAADLLTVSAMQAAITPFYAWVDGTAATVQAGYPVCLDADVVVTFGDGEPAVPRVDRVIIVVRHDAYDASGVTAGSVEILPGQPDGSPTPLPPSALLLWDVTVPAAASAGNGGINISAARVDRRTYTTAAGGILPVAGHLAAPADTYRGHSVFRHDIRQVETFDGATWRRLGQLDGPRGIVALIHNVGDSAETTNVEIIAYWLTFTAEHGRCYRITCLAPRADKGAGAPEAAVPAGSVGALRANLRWAAGATVTITSARLTYTQANLFRDDANVAGGFTLSGILNNPPPGPVTFGIGILSTVANLPTRVITEGLGQLVVEDIGRAL